MTIYNVTVNERCGGPSKVHAVDADLVQVGYHDEAGRRVGDDTVLRFYQKKGTQRILIAAFYDWDWFCEGVLTSKPSA
jgi:hypothetical protein